jgi:2-polyprenyl-3-methyl-5-hydroxy-6-metoxy-1,4-benzoquinol methylase
LVISQSAIIHKQWPQFSPWLTSTLSEGIIDSLISGGDRRSIQSPQTRGAMAQESLALTATLNQLAELDRYNHWIYEHIAHALGRRVLEIGSGTGNITQFLCAEEREVMATDIVISYRHELERMFSDNPRVQVAKFDLTAKAPEDFVANPYDSIVCLNVLEHIEDDLFALEQMRDSLAPGGKLALLVPAHQLLYGAFDRAIGHYRRYAKRELAAKLKKTGFTVREMKFFSLVAALPWFINGRLLKRDYLPAGQASLANRLVPMLKLERLIGPPCGLSLIAIAKK